MKKKLIILCPIIELIIILFLIFIIVNKNNVKTYNVYFETDGGTSVCMQTISEGEKIKKPIDPTKEGYSFDGWIYENKDYDFNLEVNSDITLTAKWTKNDNTEINEEGVTTNPSATTKPSVTTKPDLKRYTVTFNSNGGSSIASQTVIEGNKVTKPAAPTKKNYVFIGWLLNNNKYDFNTAVTSNITLVAKWALYADVNFDGAINLKDVTLIDRYIHGMIQFDDTQKLVADVNSDGLVNAKDSDILSKYLVGTYVIDSFPYNP